MQFKVIREKPLDFGSGQDRDGPARKRVGRICAGEGRYQEERPGNPDLVEFTEKGVIGKGIMHRYLPKDTGARLIGRTGSGKSNGSNLAQSSGAMIKE
jgi:hypothetical protein